MFGHEVSELRGLGPEATHKGAGKAQRDGSEVDGKGV